METPVLVCDALQTAEALTRSDQPFDVAMGAGTLLQSGRADAFSVLHEQLISANNLVRRAAVDTLISVDTPAAANVISQMVEAGTEWGELVAAGLIAVPSNGHEGVLEQIAFGSTYANKDVARAHALRALLSVVDSISERRLASLMKTTDPDSLLGATASYVALHQGVMTGEALQRLSGVVGQVGNAAAQEVAAVAFAHSDSAQTLSLLQTLSESSEPKVRIAALLSLAARGSQDAATELIEIILSGGTYGSTLAAAGLRRIPGEAAYKITRGTLSRGMPPVEGALRMIESWAWIDDDRVNEIIKWGLRQAHADLALQALWVIGWRREETYFDRITPLVRDKDPAVRGMAAWAVVRVHGKSVDCGGETA